jgi:DivIVA domain-containing protein
VAIAKGETVPLMPADVRNTRFSTTRLRPAYDRVEVDTFRDLVEVVFHRLFTENAEFRAALAGALRGDAQAIGNRLREQLLAPPERSLNPKDVLHKQFSSTTLRPGYDQEEVDAFLDEVEGDLDRLIQENEELRSKLLLETQRSTSGPPPAKVEPRPRAMPALQRASGPAPAPTPAAALSIDVAPLEPGDPSQVGRYRLTGRLGAGGMGRVFLGTSPGGRQVAVKILHPEHANDPEFRARFAREVAAARQVSGFYTAPVVDADPGAGSPWLVTAYIPGPSLARAVADRGPFPAPQVRELGAALAEGLAAIHECGLVHRDLKPGNIILAHDGPRIIDFGIARGIGGTLTAAGTLIGTFTFMSPEQIGGQRVGPESDIFSLGSVLAYALTGRGPFDAPYPAVIHRVLTQTPDLNGMHGRLPDVIMWCLQKAQADRPTISDLLTRLNSMSVL